MYKKTFKSTFLLTCALTIIAGTSIPHFTNSVIASTQQNLQELPGISGKTDGTIYKGQPDKNIPGNGQLYQIAKGITVHGNQGSPEWIFTADETAIPNTSFTIYVCGTGNSYIIYKITVHGPGSYILDASKYNGFNQGLSLEMHPTAQPIRGTVQIHYINDTGRTIAPSEKLVSSLWLEGDSPLAYQTLDTPYFKKTITHEGNLYVLNTDALPHNANGFYLPNQTINITYIYKLNEKIESKEKPTNNQGKVVVHYVDNNGKIIANDKNLPTLTWNNSSPPPYQTLHTPLFQESLIYQGQIYTLDKNKIPKNANGFYQANKTIHVNYTYKMKENTPKSSASPKTPPSKNIISTDSLFTKNALTKTEKTSPPVTTKHLSKKGKNTYLPRTGEKDHTIFTSLIGISMLYLLALYYYKRN